MRPVAFNAVAGNVLQAVQALLRASHVFTLAAEVVFDNGSKPGVILQEAMRERLTANRTYYVTTTGNDSNAGLTAATAFLTIQAAINYVAANIDLGGFTCTIQVGAGTWTQPLTPRRVTGHGTVLLLGDEVTPANVTLTPGSSFAAVFFFDCGVWNIRGFKITATNKNAIQAGGLSAVYFQNIDFGAVGTGNHIASQQGANIQATGNYTISGAAAIHWYSDNSGKISITSRTVTLTGTPAFSSQFAQAGRLSNIECQGNTFTGAATGTRYLSYTNSVIWTNAGGATYLPGNVGGSTATGGLYA